MPIYRYRAMTEGGKGVAGVIDADSLPLAKEKLLKQQVMVTHLFELEQNQKEIVLDPTLLLAFTRELGQLLRAGLPLYESLLTIEEKYRRFKSHPLFLDLCDRLKGGASLSSALKHYPKSFDRVYLSMVQAAERSASLAYIFDQLSTLISRQQKLRKQLFSSLAYPAFLGVFCLVVIGALLFFVIPSMQELFEGRQLHPLTQAVLGISRFVNENGWALLAAISLLIASTLVLLRRPEGRAALQKASLKLPFFKTVIIQAALIRFCRSTSVLLNGGVPLIEALALSRRVMKNGLLEQVVEEAEKRIVEGKSLSAQLKLSPIIPPLVVRMLAIAEETGKMAPMLQNIAEIYDEDLERNLTQMTSLLQPAILMILGAIVGVVILSILLPLTDVSSFLSN